MRPHGEIRQALASATAELVPVLGPVTWRDMAERAQVGYAAARTTACNMERAGQLVRVGAAKRAHSRRWMALYELAPPVEPFRLDAAQQLAAELQAWNAAACNPGTVAGLAGPAHPLQASM